MQKVQVARPGKCALHCGLSKAERERAAQGAKARAEAAQALVRFGVPAVTNPYRELARIAGQQIAYKDKVGEILNRLSVDELRYAGSLRGEQTRAAHLECLAALEDAAAAAERAAQNPPATVPPSAWTCLLANPLSLLMAPDLDAEGRALVSAQIASLARIARVAEELRAEGRAAHEAELADRTRHPAFVQPLARTIEWSAKESQCCSTV